MKLAIEAIIVREIRTWVFKLCFFALYNIPTAFFHRLMQAL